ncbi:uncharacterized protein B0T15DRAFT_523330 [Chaetomium strumarium]|uniref:Uncharacterized protein n=1 Tax=Chaetomium strumarium TaxID=1170767 RepID=A0AAJ0GXK4_9PEZI|nr:hypothetical protein B0T15DRAFT_523330 [Chaetomium strumarium]
MSAWRLGALVHCFFPRQARVGPASPHVAFCLPRSTPSFPLLPHFFPKPRCFEDIRVRHGPTRPHQIDLKNGTIGLSRPRRSSTATSGRSQPNGSIFRTCQRFCRLFKLAPHG